MSGPFRLPISLRLTLWYGVSMLVLLVLFGALLVTSLHWNQHLVLHQRLFKAQSDLMPEVAVTAGRPALDPPLSGRGGALEIDGPFGTYVRLLAPDGTVLDRSANFAGAAVLAPAVPADPAMVEMDRRWGAVPIRSFYAPVMADGQVAGWLEVSGHAWSVRHQLVGWHIGLILLVTMLLALAGGYVLARRALRPVARLTEAANVLSASALDIRLPVDARIRDELTDLAETFNTMVARLAESFDRERRFTANAAHELLNPLAAIRNEVEVALRRDREAPAYREALRTVQADIKRMGRLVEQLLELARVEAADGATGGADLAAVCKEAVAAWTPAAARRGLTLEADVAGPAPVAVDAAHLGIVVDNLLDNAIKYTPGGGRVTLTLAVEPPYVRLTVTDTGVGFDEATAAQLFDRFYRAASPEVQAEPGSGLGLALVQAIVQAHDGTLTAHSPGPGQGCIVAVRLHFGL